MESTFGLGISVSPVWPNEQEPDRVLDVARIATRHGASAFLLGDKPGRDPAVRSNAVILGWLLGELAGVPRVGSLFLVRSMSVDNFLATVRTLADLVRRQGATLAVGVMHGRGGSAKSTPGPDLDSVITALSDKAGGFELWVAAEQGPALDRAARTADVWLANAYHGEQVLSHQRERVIGGSRGPVRAAVRRDFVCAADSSDAHTTARRLLADGYRGGTFDERTLIAGTPEECVEQMAAVAGLGFQDVLVRPALGGARAVEQLQMLFEYWSGIAAARPLTLPSK